MAEPKFSKTRWEISTVNDGLGENGGIAIDSVPYTGRFEVCEVWGVDNDTTHDERSRAHAYLICAAPELYDALADMTDLLERIGDSRKDAPIIDAALAALAKARGET